MPRSAEVKFDHDRELSALATWWKAMLLTPAWGFLVMMPMGAFANILVPQWAPTIFFAMIALSVFYFWRDLHRRFVEISDNKLYFGLGCHNLSELKRIKLGYSSFKLPNSLSLEFEKDGRKNKVVLMLASMSWKDVDNLIDVLGRRVSGLHIDEEVESMLRSHKPLVVTRINDPEHLEINFHAQNLMKELPGVLSTTIYEWSRVVGPIGTFIMFTPFWMIFNMTLFNMLRDYSSVAANQPFYDELIKFLSYYSNVASSGLFILDKMLNWFASFRLAGLAVAIALAMAVYFTLLKNLWSPNRLIVNRDEVSLDMWGHLWSINSASIKWKDVKKVALKSELGGADPNKWEISISGDDSSVCIPLASIEKNDRQNLARALERFAPESTIGAAVTEALMPRQDKNHNSYTELWLQSLSGSSRVNLEPLVTGHLLACRRYEIVETLAVGGEGVAYIAHDLSQINTGTVSEVVLKETLIPPYVDKEVQQQSVERFEREATMLKELDSEHIVGLKDYFIEEKRCYLVLEYVKGQTLRQHVESSGGLGSTPVLDLAKQMIEMLTFLHGKQIIHRDFTPDNLILQTNGSLKLIDFNVARQWHTDDGKTGTIVGKHAYVPPEQFRGKAIEASDIYAMGATLYFLMSGVDPEPITQSVLVGAAESGNTEMIKLNEVIKRSTALNTSHRLASASEVAALLASNDDSDSFVVSLKVTEDIIGG
jgi:tRNA A-37 threonylcarbamoyl transferase component Bud32